MSHLRTELPRPIDVLGLPIRPLDLSSLVDEIVVRARQRITTLGCYANAHTVNLACRDTEYRQVLRQCDLLYADGVSLVWASQFAESPISRRITAMDYLPVLADRCAREGLSLFLLGSRPGIIDKAARQLQSSHPDLRIVGWHHGYFDLADSEQVIDRINAVNPDILLVGMSSPRQEFWLRESGDKLQAPVRWCVGALFDYLGGDERRAPAWMRRLGCEWLFRLAVDPVGKWRRYLLGNPRFIWNALRWRLARSGSTAASPMSTESVSGAHPCIPWEPP